MLAFLHFPYFERILGVYWLFTLIISPECIFLLLLLWPKLVMGMAELVLARKRFISATKDRKAWMSRVLASALMPSHISPRLFIREIFDLAGILLLEVACFYLFKHHQLVLAIATKMRIKIRIWQTKNKLTAINQYLVWVSVDISPSCASSSAGRLLCTSIDVELSSLFAR